jgi:hypothetical protein
MVDGDNEILTSTNPVAGGWNVTQLNGPHVLSAVSCPTSGLCVATDDTGNILSTTNPTGGAGAWAVTPLPQASYNLWAISCPTVRFCVAVDHDSGAVLSSSNPTGGSSAWRSATIMRGGVISLLGISCPTDRLCVATDDGGTVHTSIDPTAGQRAWSSTFIDGVPNSSLAGVLRGVSCPTARLCVAIDQAGNAFASTNPAGPPVEATKPSVSRASLRGYWQARPAVGVYLAAGIPPAGELTTLQFDLPPGLTASRVRRELGEGVVVRTAGGRLIPSLSSGGGDVVIVRLRKAAVNARVTLSSPALVVSNAARLDPAPRRQTALASAVTVTDTRGHRERLTFTLTARS